jgi:hypothetical protein
VYGVRRGIYRVLVGKPEGKRPLGRPRHRWEDNIKVDLQEVGCGGMNYIELAYDREGAGICECGNESSDSIKCKEILHPLQNVLLFNDSALCDKK